MNYINVNNLYNYYNRNNTFASNLVYFLIHNFLDILVVSCDLITDLLLQPKVSFSLDNKGKNRMREVRGNERERERRGSQV